MTAPGLETASDRERIGKQREIVKKFMLWAANGRLWRTLEEAQRGMLMQYNVLVPLPSLSARLRDLRKQQYGGYRVERRSRGRGLFEYRVFEPETEQGTLPLRSEK
jgi:hypothetical protein